MRGNTCGTEAKGISASLNVIANCRRKIPSYPVRHRMDDDQQPVPPRWSEEPEPVYKALGWGCLLLASLPILYVFYIVFSFCEYRCG
ncbi:hypothetical protein GCM10022253_28030 [Sphingomonas endophytica]